MPLLVRQDEQELLPMCAERGVVYLSFSPLAGGCLTGKYRRRVPDPPGSRMTQQPEPYADFVTDRTSQALTRLQSIATSRGTSMAGLALGWLLADDRVAQIVTGPGARSTWPPVARPGGTRHAGGVRQAEISDPDQRQSQPLPVSLSG